MKILSVDKRRKHLCLVKTESGEHLIDDETVVVYGIKKGMLVDDSVLEEIIEHSEYTRAKSRALWLVSMRDYSRKELFNKLKPLFSADAIERALDELVEAGVVDDMRFAVLYAEELSEIRGLSRMNIRQKLIAKGISREIISEIIDGLDYDETQAIVELISTKYNNFENGDKEKNRMISALIRKGYSFDDIRCAIDEYIENRKGT